MFGNYFSYFESCHGHVNHGVLPRQPTNPAEASRSHLAQVDGASLDTREWSNSGWAARGKEHSASLEPAPFPGLVRLDSPAASRRRHLARLAKTSHAWRGHLPHTRQRHSRVKAVWKILRYELEKLVVGNKIQEPVIFVSSCQE